jgi:large subunit ribosomal protein L1
MAKLGGKLQAAHEKVELDKTYIPSEALQLVKDCAAANFKESVDVCVNLGVDPLKSDQVVRGATVLPNGIGKTVRVAVFAEGDQAKAAMSAGADLVGLDDLAEQVKKGQIDFDVAIATPDSMRVVGQLGQILGPRGLMPNPKVGTVSADVASAVKNAKAGQVRFRTDKGGIIHCSIGTVEFDTPLLEENLKALVADLVKAKPASAKGVYVRKVTVSSTMGVGVHVDQTALVRTNFK